MKSPLLLPALLKTDPNFDFPLSVSLEIEVRGQESHLLCRLLLERIIVIRIIKEGHDDRQKHPGNAAKVGQKSRSKKRTR